MSDPRLASAAPGVWRRLVRQPVAVLSMALLVMMGLLAIFGPIVFHTDPHTPSSVQFAAPTLQKILPPIPPSVESRAPWFGTDINGRDLFSRVLEGARISLLVGIAGATVSFFIGTTYGLIAGYIGGRVDSFMMRLVEVLYALPRLIIIIMGVFFFDPKLKAYLAENIVPWITKLVEGHFGFENFEQAHAWSMNLIGYSKVIILILALGVIEWLTMARIVRGQVLALKSQQFVMAARALGQSHVRIMVRHLLPNLLGVVIVYLTLTIPSVILDESFLSFLGLGVQAPQASWGTLLSDGAQVINAVRSNWWLLVFPAIAMSITLLALNFLGDALRDALDPRGRRSS